MPRRASLEMQAQIHSQSLELARLRQEVKECRAAINGLQKRVQDSRAEIDRMEKVGQKYTLLKKKRVSEKRRVSKQTRARHAFFMVTVVVIFCHVLIPVENRG